MILRKFTTQIFIAIVLVIVGTSLSRAYDISTGSVNGKTLISPTIAILDHYGTQNYIAPNGEVTSIPLYKMIGDTFSYSSIDPIIWSSSIGASGVVATANAQLVMQTGTVANNATSVHTRHVARFSGLAPNKTRIVVQLPEIIPPLNNTREWGIYTTTDGALFDYTDGKLCAVTRKTSVDTKVCSGAFNGQYGLSFTPGTTSHFYEIIWQPRQVVWLADNKVIHSLNANAATWSDNLHLPVRYDNFNSNGSSTNVTLLSRLGVAARFGIPQTQVDGYFQQGLTDGIQIKVGPGNLHFVTLSGVTNNSVVSLYDGISTAGALIWSSGMMGAQTIPFTVIFGGESFESGLFLTVMGAASNVKVTFD